ncbi:MAG TPA: T9SS type A sorting domain-containing protein [Bacteroidia bacterium]|nr:T9SS type A sorting domain-containing protein [Bacteroidia bacterium]
MKKLTTIFLILSVSKLIAQTDAATPNANFEHWTHTSSGSGYDDANGWNDLNSSTSILGSITCYKDSTAADVKSGKYAVELVTMKVFTQDVPGALTTGTINTSNQTISGGIPYTSRPDSITGWYKYTSVSGDNADVEFYLFGSGGNSDTVAKAFFRSPKSSVTSYTRISYPLTYVSSSPAVTALWILSSSTNAAGAQVGSTLIVDSLGLITNPVSVNNIVNTNSITVGPNPARDLITIRNISNTKTLKITLFDVTGRKMMTQNAGIGTCTIDITEIPEGVYIYTVQDPQNLTIKTGRIVVQK